MLRRQWGVPAFNSRPALASRGTTHCTRSPMATSDSGFWARVIEQNAYRPKMASQIPTRIPTLREKGILVLGSILGFACCWRANPRLPHGQTITRYGVKLHAG